MTRKQKILAGVGAGVLVLIVLFLILGGEEDKVTRLEVTVSLNGASEKKKTFLCPPSNEEEEVVCGYLESVQIGNSVGPFYEIPKLAQQSYCREVEKLNQPWQARVEGYVQNTPFPPAEFTYDNACTATRWARLNVIFQQVENTLPDLPIDSPPYAYPTEPTSPGGPTGGPAQIQRETERIQEQYERGGEPELPLPEGVSEKEFEKLLENQNGGAPSLGQ